MGNAKDFIASIPFTKVRAKRKLWAMAEAGIAAGVHQNKFARAGLGNAKPPAASIPCTKARSKQNSGQ